MPEPKRPTVDEVLAGALHTIENQLLPNLEDTWARAAASQLMGTLEYARAIIASDEHVDGQVEEVEAVVANLVRDHPGLEAVLEGSAGETRGFTAMEQASRLLSHAVGNESAEAEAIRAELRPVIVQQAADNLAETSTMLMRFGGTPRRVER